MDNRDKGLYEKYHVERADGKDVGECIVLEFDDPNARAGILTFANSVLEDGYEELYYDLIDKLNDYTDV